MKEEHNIKQVVRSKREAIIEERDSLKTSILKRVEEKIEKKFTDEYIDRESLKIELRSGAILDLDKLKYVTSVLQDYDTRFPQEFYREIFRLNRHRGSEWNIPESSLISQKPHIVGRWTNEIIYSRFGKDVLPALEINNPYITIGLRKYKHHQFLNEQGIEKLELYIQDAISVMKVCNEWYEFRIKLFETHGVPYQLDIFH